MTEHEPNRHDSYETFLPRSPEAKFGHGETLKEQSHLCLTNHTLITRKGQRFPQSQSHFHQGPRMEIPSFICGNTGDPYYSPLAAPSKVPMVKGRHLDAAECQIVTAWSCCMADWGLGHGQWIFFRVYLSFKDLYYYQRSSRGKKIFQASL